MKLKNKKAYICLVCAISFLFFSCVESVEKKEKKLFPKEKKIVFGYMGVDEHLGKPRHIKSMNNYLVVTEKNIDTQIQIINKETKENYLFGQTGEGPGGLLSSADIIPINDKDIGIYDLQKRTLFGFNIDSIIRLNIHCKPEVLINKIPSFPLSIGRLNEHTYVTLGLESGLKRLTFLNASGEISSMEGSLPAKKDENVSDFVHAFAYWGRLTTNLKESKIAVCTNYAGMTQIYDCKTDSIRLIREHNLFVADYDERAGNFAPNAQTRWGYISMDSNDKYIFALYSGLNQFETPDAAFTRSNTVHVFDWNGSPVCRLLLDKTVSHICVDDDNLYGYGYDGEKADIMLADIRDVM